MEGLSIIGSVGLPCDDWLLEDLGVLSLRTSGDIVGDFASKSSSWSVPKADLEIVVIPLPSSSPTLLIKLGYFRKFFFLYPSSYSFFTDYGPSWCISSISENLTADFGSDISSLSVIFPFLFFY